MEEIRNNYLFYDEDQLKEAVCFLLAEYDKLLTDNAEYIDDIESQLEKLKDEVEDQKRTIVLLQKNVPEPNDNDVDAYIAAKVEEEIEE